MKMSFGLKHCYLYWNPNPDFLGSGDPFLAESKIRIQKKKKKKNTLIRSTFLGLGRSIAIFYCLVCVNFACFRWYPYRAGAFWQLRLELLGASKLPAPGDSKPIGSTFALVPVKQFYQDWPRKVALAINGLIMA